MSDAPRDVTAGGPEPGLDWSAFPAVDAATWRARVDKDLEGRPFEKLRETPFEGVSIDPLYASVPVVPDPPGTGDRVRGIAQDKGGWVIAPSYRDDGRDDGGVDLAAAIRHDVALGAGAAWVTCVGEPDADVIARWRDALGAGDLFLELPTADAASPVGVTVLDPLGVMASRGDGAVVNDEVRSHTARMVGTSAAVWGIGTSVYADAGADPSEQLGVMLSTGATYLRWCASAGIELGAAASTAWATLSVGRDLFVEIAKLRAARRLWARMCAACGIEEHHRGLQIRAVGSLRERTQRDPWVNLLRGTTETFSAAMGGAQLISTLPLDAALPGYARGGADFGRRLAVNTQVLLREESHLRRVVDPAGGSYYVESLTDALARAGWEAFRRIESEGGIEQGLRTGAVQARIAHTHQAAARDVARRKLAIVGVSEFPTLDEMPVPGAGPSTAEASSEGSGGDLDGLPVRRLAEPFESLRERSDALFARTGGRPKALTLGLGPLAVHKPRADFAHNLLLAGGFEVVPSEPVESVDEAVATVSKLVPAVVVLCSSDELYAEHAAGILQALGGVRQRPTLVLAGRAGTLAGELHEAGLDHELFLGCDAVALLDALLTSAEEFTSS